MELSYWESRWKKDKTGFHMREGYPGLREHWPSLDLPPNPHVFVPLCGKSLDMIFFEQHGASVVGVEISEKAILSFFSENRLRFDTIDYAGFKIYKSENIELWQGDILKYPTQKAGFSLIYDKAALVALPPEKQKPYVNKLLSIADDNTSILLHHFVYPQNEMPGPPFSISPKKLEDYFAGHFTISMLEENQLPAEQFIPFQRRGLKSSLTERLLFLKTR